MITIKHLARDFNLDPYALRGALRAAGLEPQINRRWKWEDAEGADYLKARVVASTLASVLKSRSINSSGSASATPKQPSATASVVRKVPATSRATRSSY